MKNETACFTGHRIIANTDLLRLTPLLDETVEKFVSRGVIHWVSGGAIGFDTLAAQAIIKQREKNPAVKLIMVLPSRDQDARWRESDRQKYRLILDAADDIICLSEHYDDGCMAARNRFLVEHSDVCVAYMKRARSGAGQTVRMARECGLTVVNLAEIWK